ncbi:MAG: DUF2309 domain-containing protein [Planctomycetia bacterium]|nr:DUF2309 domain-containing protein [Planctomycetia bacterium]
MPISTPSTSANVSASSPISSTNAFAKLEEVIARAGELLPAQGPITAFVFLNTLQALEDLPFDEGLQHGARLFGCQPYLAEDFYRAKLEQGRIRPRDLAEVLHEDLGAGATLPVCDHATRYDLRYAMLEHTLRMGPAEELRWFVAETDALTRIRADVPREKRDRLLEETRHWVMRDLRRGNSPNKAHSWTDPNSGVLGASVPTQAQVRNERRSMEDLLERFGEASIERWSPTTWEAFTLAALWRVCREGVHGLEVVTPPRFSAVRHRDYLLEATGIDSDVAVDELLIRFCAAFTDQGFADWPLPSRNQGFYKSFCVVYGQAGGPPNSRLAGLSQELARLETAAIGPRESILESLAMLGVGEREWSDYIIASLLALRGWAGLIRQNEVRGDRVALPVPQGTLVEFLAVRLILERLSLAHIAEQELHYQGPLHELTETSLALIAKKSATGDDQRAFLLFQLAQVSGWSPAALLHLSRTQWETLVAEVEGFSGLERRKIFHQAFERKFRSQVLDAFSTYTNQEKRRVPNPRFQAVFCIDTREESFRRHIEEVAPDAETFSAAGFYGVAIYYKGVADAHYSTLCPIVLKPAHWVVEEVVYSLEETNRRRAKTRKALGTASHQMHVGSRSIAKGAVLTAGLGVLASVPLVARVLFPRLTARIRRGAGSFVQAPAITRLRLERTLDPPGPDGDQIGFSVTEMADRSERMLRDLGLLDGFARIIFFFGHGSFCLNNPHKSAYDCGACSGGAGGPNARALAAMLNDRRVRDILKTRGLTVPDDTVFVGALHNTCADSLTFFDLDLLPKSHRNDFENALNSLERVCERNAHERCRRFDSAPLNISFAGARRHVEGRSEDLAQTRPEFGNASNAICFVGRRARVRGLYLDRRSFLNSYDPLQDDADGTILARILAAAVPVCSGINLQYTLSYIDNPGWGCGTKLPHNVTSLLGVMDGAQSDLRTGLPWQGVEIHEPVRLLFVIETTPEKILGIMKRNETVGRILRNGWAQLALLDPLSSKILTYRNGSFEEYRSSGDELPTAPTSADWYRGWRDHLGFAVIQP